MNIVFDLRYASEHFPGIGTFANGLFSALVALPTSDCYHVLWNPAAEGTRFGRTSRVEHDRVHWVGTAESPLGWRAPIATGTLLRRTGGDVYLSPFYLRPVGSPMPVVLTLHDALHLTRESGSPLGLRVRFALALRHARGADALLTVSEFARDDLVRRAGIPAKQLSVVPNGVPPRFSGEPVRPAGAPARPFALVIGANRPHKQLSLLAEVWRKLGEQRPLDLVAAGPIDTRFPSLVQLTNCAGVHELGSVSAAELEWLYANAVLLVLPTLYEGFGLPLLEAMDRGLPVIASNIPALRETGGNAPRYALPGDLESWCAAVMELAKDPAARERMRVLGKERAKHFDWAVSAARAREVLASVAKVSAA